MSTAAVMAFKPSGPGLASLTDQGIPLGQTHSCTFRAEGEPAMAFGAWKNLLRATAGREKTASVVAVRLVQTLFEGSRRQRLHVLNLQDPPHQRLRNSLALGDLGQ